MNYSELKYEIYCRYCNTKFMSNFPLDATYMCVSCTNEMSRIKKNLATSKARWKTFLAIVLPWIIAIICIGALIAILEGCAYASDPWTSGDTIRESVYLTMLAIDWGQTNNGLYTPHKDYEGYELNPIIGRHPTKTNLAIIIASTAIGHGIISYLLPEDWRAGFQYVTIGMEITAVGHNSTVFGMQLDY
jgi:hypothetical protein